MEELDLGRGPNHCNRKQLDGFHFGPMKSSPFYIIKSQNEIFKLYNIENLVKMNHFPPPPPLDPQKVKCWGFKIWGQTEGPFPP